jgi:hypothetical protein
MRKIIEYCLVSTDVVFDDPDPSQMGARAYQDDACTEETTSRGKR